MILKIFLEKGVDKVIFLDYYRHIKQKRMKNKKENLIWLLEKEDSPMGQ